MKKRFLAVFMIVLMILPMAGCARGRGQTADNDSLSSDSEPIDLQMKETTGEHSSDGDEADKSADDSSGFVSFSVPAYEMDPDGFYGVCHRFSSALTELFGNKYDCPAVEDLIIEEDVLGNLSGKYADPGKNYSLVITLKGNARKDFGNEITTVGIIIHEPQSIYDSDNKEEIVVGFIIATMFGTDKNMTLSDVNDLLDQYISYLNEPEDGRSIVFSYTIRDFKYQLLYVTSDQLFFCGEAIN